MMMSLVPRHWVEIRSVVSAPGLRNHVIFFTCHVNCFLTGWADACGVGCSDPKFVLCIGQ